MHSLPKAAFSDKIFPTKTRTFQISVNIIKIIIIVQQSNIYIMNITKNYNDKMNPDKKCSKVYLYIYKFQFPKNSNFLLLLTWTCFALLYYEQFSNIAVWICYRIRPISAPPFSFCTYKVDAISTCNTLDVVSSTVWFYYKHQTTASYLN